MLAGLRFGPHLSLACKLRSRNAKWAGKASDRHALRHGGDCAPRGPAAGAARCRMRRSFYSRCRNCMARVAEPPQCAGGAARRGDVAPGVALAFRPVLARGPVYSEGNAGNNWRAAGAGEHPQRRPSRRGAACGRVLPGQTARGSV
ncbi:hypothetical protein CBM2605_B110178 [Cupriavidus neocaledonicus]|uniref:Uncharacterized protein n=1 Tax=Cupriavidus neocaledonicus TaxID=1040979 RepID=A0ABY1V8V8_9BURK|nr:hypothetical protein CBM2605_B110178 [Cupriavidus neocaledonicus]